MASVMITTSLFLSLICLVAVFSASDGNESGECSGTANYLLSFYGLWKQDRHPNTALPSNAHFSPLVGCSHGSDYVMWRAGEKASAGVELVAERGRTSTLVNEINAQITAEKAWKLILPGGQLGPEAMKTGIDVEVNANFSKVSIITMLAPSPDWFIGIDSVDLCDSGKWRESMNVTMLPPWDAGTEDGTAFSLSNAATDPHVNIFEITNNTAGAFNAPNPIASLGEFRFMGLHLPVVTQDNSTINSNSTMNSTSAPPLNRNSTSAPPLNKDSTSAPPLNKNSTSAPPLNKDSTSAPPLNKNSTSAPPLNKNSTSVPPLNKNSAAMSSILTKTDSSVGKASASFGVFVSTALILAKMLH